jgi:signal peptidase I
VVQYQKAPVKGDTRNGSLLRELPVLAIVSLAIALVVKSFVVQAFFIPSGSMRPTLVAGDRVLVEKLSQWTGDPARGDLIVFERELSPAQRERADQPVLQDIENALKELFALPTDGEQDLIKRVIGIGGDVVEARDGRVRVNGEPVEEPYLDEGVTTADFSPVEVPEGSLFVLGDNRGRSEDSRIFGAVETDKVVGIAFLLIWPPRDFRTL